MAWESDPKLCWSCGEPGIPYVGSRMRCLECEVTWMPFASPPPESQTAA